MELYNHDRSASTPKFGFVSDTTVKKSRSRQYATISSHVKTPPKFKQTATFPYVSKHTYVNQFIIVVIKTLYGDVFLHDFRWVVQLSNTAVDKYPCKRVRTKDPVATHKATNY